MLNDWQKIIVKTYRDGEYANLFDEATHKREVQRIAKATNDGLFIYLMEEFAAVRTYADAKQRLLEAQEEISAFAASLIMWKDEDA